MEKTRTHLPSAVQHTDAQAWKDMFEAYGSSLLAILDALLPCRGCREHVLHHAELQMGAVNVADHFRLHFAMRAVVKAAISHARICVETTGPHADPPAQFHMLRDLPMAERFVFYMRETLGYPLRDVALLMDFSDAQTEQLHRLANHRMHCAQYGLDPPRGELPRMFRTTSFSFEWLNA